MTLPSVFNGNPAVDFPTVMLMHLDGARGILDYSKNRQTLTPTNASMGSTVTPKFGAQELTCPSNGYVSWPTKVVSADCTKPMTVEFWVNPVGNSPLIDFVGVLGGIIYYKNYLRR